MTPSTTHFIAAYLGAAAALAALFLFAYYFPLWFVGLVVMWKLVDVAYTRRA